MLCDSSVVTPTHEASGIQLVPQGFAQCTASADITMVVRRRLAKA